MSRIDLEVRNEATGFMISSRGLCGHDFSKIEGGDEAWLAATRDGVILPIELAQDEPFLIRVLVNEPLSAQEDAEWIGRSSHRLRIPDGKLEITGGGSEFLWDDDSDEYTQTLDIPPGDYLAELYTFLQGVNGIYTFDQSGDPEPLGAYFRRTRPRVPLPLWLRNECCADPDIDPGHSAEWKHGEFDFETDQPPFLSFLLRLSPFHEEPAAVRLEEGWVAAGQGARRPAKCPLGIVAEPRPAVDAP
ncbi:hypothetical protein [Aquisphaera insulae]|uniref:hypothetical protein n=1 Tax=Aquisphaera insulae TaxID=2712864 RepID=UPI0013EA8342|nr:hypothetical protein [Aquisphaera insulae]